MYFLIDLENVGIEGLRGVEYLNSNDKLTIFYSNAIKQCENRYLDKIMESGCEFDTCKLMRTGKNGLDFYIACSIGQYFGAGNPAEVTIVSKDRGFQAVRDYWQVDKDEKYTVHIAHNIEKGILATSDGSDRYNKARHAEERVDLEVFQARYEERMHFQNVLREIFAGTEFDGKTEEIKQLLDGYKVAENKKIIYLDSLHRFGRKRGLDIYNKIKPMLKQA